MNSKCVYTALIGPYEDLKEPTVITPGWDYIVFTDQEIESKVWRVISAFSPTPQRTARRIKILPHEYLPDYEQTIWIDASFQINVSLDALWNGGFRAPFSAPRHPIRNCVYAEVRSCIANERGDRTEIHDQGEVYKAEGMPGFQGIITSGFLLRQKTQQCIELCNAWWEELSKRSVRDQIAFAYVTWKCPWWNYKNQTFRWDYSTSKELKYFKHYHKRH